jgi:soluble lytic murein transglycosylase
MTFRPIAKATLAAFLACSVLALGARAETDVKKPASAAASQERPASASANQKKPTTAAKAPKKTVVAAAKLRKAVPMPRPRPVQIAAISRHPTKPIPSAAPILSASLAPMQLTPTATVRTAPIPGALIANAPIPTAESPEPARRPAPLVASPSTTASADDIATVKKAADLVRNGKTDEATKVEKSISDPFARKLVEWLVLRTDDGAGFDRYAAFIFANPSWPSIALLRKRAEGALWEERRDPATVRAFFAAARPVSAKGRLALARALLAAGGRQEAENLVREAWHQDAMSREMESMAIEAFGEFLTPADHQIRMDRRLYADDAEAGLRAAARLGGNALAIARARAAVIEKSANANALLEAVPAEARNDPGYMLSRIQWLRRNDKLDEAAQLMLAAPRDPAVIHDVDEWWTERRVLVRKLLDDDAQAAYRMARDGAAPIKENYRADQQFTAGWIALRFLHDPATALGHFARIAQGVANPITLARAGYWQGRALEALGRRDEARTHYEAAARFTTAYYGQIARARLGLGEIALNPPPQPSREKRAALLNLEVVRAAELLYAVDAPDLVAPMVQDLAERADDVGALVVLAELAQQHHDARSMLLIGKTVLGRGFSFDHFAFPDVGVPKFAAITREVVDRSVIYAIVRQESAFNAKVASSANAQGLMQIMPGTGRAIAKKFRVNFDKQKLAHDPAYNAQLGSAELGDLLQDYRGSYILTFAAYNAGRARVRQWLAQFGDPRDPKVDPIDWVEHIPFSETRNYVQRVMENMQVYRLRLGGSAQLMIEADLRRGGEN